MYSLVVSAILGLASYATLTSAVVSGGFHLVQTESDRMIFNYNVYLSVNDSLCLNVTDVQKVPYTTPFVQVDTIPTNPSRATFDISFNFFPHRQTIGGVPTYLYYKNSTKLYEYEPQSYWRVPHPEQCSSDARSVPDLKWFEEICIVNTCQKSTCEDDNTFKGQLTIVGYTTDMKLSRNPVVAECGNPTVGQVEYVAFYDTNTIINFQTTVNDTPICLSLETPASIIGGVGYNALTVNLTMNNNPYTDHFGVEFLYPLNGPVDKFAVHDWNSGFEHLGQPFEDECVGGYTEANSLPTGWNQICIVNTCDDGAACGYETYSGTLTITGQRLHDRVNYVGSVDQICTDTIYAPTLKPTEGPPIKRGDIAAIVLLSTLGFVLIVFTVYGFVLGFRRLKRQNGINDGSEVTDPGCTWQGWF